MKNTILLVFSSVMMLIFMAINNSVYPDMRGHYAITLLIVMLYGTHNAINYYFNNKPKKLTFECEDGSIIYWRNGLWDIKADVVLSVNAVHTIKPCDFKNFNTLLKSFMSDDIEFNNKIVSYKQTAKLAKAHIDAMQLETH
jgi:hypothetical protein